MPKHTAILFPQKYPDIPERLEDGNSKPVEFSTWTPPAEYKATVAKKPTPSDSPPKQA